MFVAPRSKGHWYQSAFLQTQNPISESAVWHHTDPHQTPVQTASGIAYGTQTGSNGFDDSGAFLSGFPPNQRVTAIVHKTTAQPSFLEFEILLRWSEGPTYTPGSFGATNSYGYEINCNSEGAYVQIGQFKGPNLFDSNSSGSPITSMGVHDGDVYMAQIVGNPPKITVYMNGTLIASATDNTGTAFLTGNPGIGFFRQDSGGTIDPTACCFKHVVAEGLP